MNQKLSLLWVFILGTSILHGMEKDSENKNIKQQLLGLVTSYYPYLSKKQPQDKDPLEVVIQTGPVRDMRLTKNDQLVTLGGKSKDPNENDTFLSVWSASNGKLVNRFDTLLPITTFDVGSDGLTAATCFSPGAPINAPSQVQVWLIEKNKRLYEWYMTHLADKVFLTNDPHGYGYGTHNTYLWVTNPSNKKTYQYKTATGELLTTINVPCATIDPTHYIGAGLTERGFYQLNLCFNGNEDKRITEQKKTKFISIGYWGWRSIVTSGEDNEFINIIDSWVNGKFDTSRCIQIFNNEEEVSGCVFKKNTFLCEEVVSFDNSTVKIWKTGEDAPIYTKEFKKSIKHLGTNNKKFAAALDDNTVVVCNYPFEYENEEYEKI